METKPFRRCTSARIMALKDIAEWMREQKIQKHDEHGDIWVVSAYALDTPEQRRLNKELGVSKVNYTSKAMSRKKK
jgi:ribosomal protein L18E